MNRLRNLDTFEWVILGLIALVIIVIGAHIRFLLLHECVRSHQAWVKPSPIYVRAGDTMIPLDQPMRLETVCEEWRRK